MSWSFEAGARVGQSERYKLVTAYPSPGVWRARDELSGRACRLRALQLPMPDRVEAELKEREKQRILREFDKWREVKLARPSVVDLFWQGELFCWVEEPVRGAPLSSLNEPMATLDGLSLVEEVLFTLEDHHSHTDFMTGEPLLHLNIHPSTILRAEGGQLYLMDPLCPAWLQLKAQHTRQRLEEVDGAHAPEMRRGRSLPSSDLYALGMSCLAAMSNMSLKRVDQRLNSGRLLSHDLTLAPSVQAFFERLVNIRTSERFQSATEALSALRALPREVYEPLGALLNQAARPVASPPQIEQPASMRRATVKVDDAALSSFELGDEEGGAQPELRLESSAHLEGVGPLEAEAESEPPLQADRAQGVTQAMVVYEPEAREDPDELEAVALAFYTRAHEPRPQGGGLSAADGVTEVEVVEERRARGPLLLLLAVVALGLGLWLRGQDAERGTQKGTQKGTQQLRAVGAQGASTRERGLRSQERVTSTEGSSASQKPMAKRAPSSPQQAARAAALPVWVTLAGGLVWVGALEGEGYADERPRRRVKVEPFQLSQTEVTVRQYTRCVEGGSCDLERVKTPDWGDAQQCNWGHPERLDHPMNCVSWRQALDYARWVGARLPSEAEWSFAAQGGREAPEEGLRYPWGQKSKGCGFAVLHQRSRGDGCGHGGTAPVCSAPKGDTAQGLCDMAGNVWEWMTDEYHPSYQDAPVDGSAWALRPLDRWSQVERALRGSAFDERDQPRVARRNHYAGGAHLATVGFRLARDAERPPPAELTSPIEPPEAGSPGRPAAPSGERLLKPATD